MRQCSAGITLLELMITVAIVALLASIAYPSYQNQIRRSNRTEAKVELMKTAQTLERCYTMASKYTGCAAVSLPYTTPAGKYVIAEGAGGVEDTTFELSATPQGAQAKDTDCATFSITHDTAHKATKSGGADNTSTCWK